MDELFRFSVIRPVTKSEAKTIDLSRPFGRAAILQQNVNNPDNVANYFQDQLRTTIQNLTQSHSSNEEIWSALEPIAIDYVLNNSTNIFKNAYWNDLQDFLTALLQLTPDMLVPSKWPVSKWATDGKNNIVQLAELFMNHTQATLAQLNSFKLDMGDLFIALLIIRRGGPANLNALIKAHTPPLWFYTELLSSNPTLQEISERINLVELISTGPSALIVPSNGVATPDVQTLFQSNMSKTLLFPSAIFSLLQKPVHGVGYREFHLVKQHIKGYELGEVAKIENILKGESRDHSTKHSLSNETDTFSQTISSSETDTELDSTDHVKIQNESQSQVKEDTKLDGGIHAQISGGDSYKLQTDLSVSYNRSTDDSKKFASEVSKDVTKKATTKVSTQVTQSQTNKIVETFEESEDQSFDNKVGPDNISGVYQWVDKIYLAQTFNLGKHMLFDFMVPEPALNLLGLATIPPTNLQLPVKPDPLGTIKGIQSIVAFSPGSNQGLMGQFVPTLDSNGNKILDKPLQPDDLKTMNDVNFWVGKFQVTGVEQPPPQIITVSDSLSVDGRDSTHNDVKENKILTIPDGYYADSTNMAVGWYSADKNDVDQQITIAVGDYNFNFGTQTSDSAVIKTSIWNNNYSGRINGARLANDQSIQGQIGVAIKSVNDDQVTLSLEIVCKASDELNNKWRLQAYEKILAAWQKLESDYESKIASLQFQGPTVGPLGSTNPDQNRFTERMELKRSCIAIIDNNNDIVRGVGSAVSVQEFPVVTPKDASDPNYPQLTEPNLFLAQTVGSKVRWFEQAFEWENMAYIFYPYYWGRRSNWIQSLNLKNDDPLFLSFLQAGYARVVVPVRLGFENAVLCYLLTGLPWMGGDLPLVGDNSQNPLYLDIAEEIKTSTNGGTDDELEIPINEPWEIKLPTTLIKLRPDNQLPSWTRKVPDNKIEGADYSSDPQIGPWAWSEDANPKAIPFSNS